jgi:hypothetical protein
MNPAIRLLVVTAIRNRSNSYITDWLSALKRRRDLHVVHVDTLAVASNLKIRRALRYVDAIVLLHSVTADSLRPAQALAPILSERRAPVAVLLGNELNLPWAPLSEKIRFLSDIGAEIVGTQLLLDAGKHLYGDTGAKVLEVPHAVDPTQFKYREPTANKKLRIGTRTAQYLPIIGDRDRPRFLEAVTAAALSHGWSVDISDNRFSSGKWSEYLASLDVTVSTEAGSFFTEPSDDLVNDILKYVRSLNHSLSVPVTGVVSSALRHLPWRVRQWLRKASLGGVLTNDLRLLQDANPDEIIDRFFRHRDCSQEYTKALSSRHIEAASVGTPQLLLEGRYNNVLAPGRHYVPVKTDLSDLESGLLQLADVEERRRIARSARTHVEQFHTLNHRIDMVMDELLGALN